MRPLLLPLLGILSFSALQPVLAAEPLAAILPDHSKVFFNVSNLSQLRDSKDHPMVKALTTGELGKALQPVMDKLFGEVEGKTAALLKEETGLTMEEILAKFPGEAAGSISVSLQKLERVENFDLPDFGASLVLDYTGDEALMKKLLAAGDKLQRSREAENEEGKEGKKEEEGAEKEEDEKPAKPAAVWPEDYDENITEIDGVKVHEWTVSNLDQTRGESLSWSIAKGKAAFTLGKSDLKEIITRLVKSSTEGSLGTTSAWKTMPASIQDSDLLGGVNLETLMGDIQEGLRLKMEKGELNTGGLPINPLQAWTGAGLDQFRMAFLDVNVEGGDAVLHLGLTYAEKPALMKIYAAKGPGVPPAFVPADVQEVSWGTLDWGGFYDNIKELAVSISPMAAGGIEMGTTELKKKIGVDLRQDILGQMGDGLWSVSHTEPVEADATDKKKESDKKSGDEDGETETESSPLSAYTKGQSQVIGIDLRDSKAFGISLKSIFNTLAPGAGLFDDRKFMDTTIHQIKGLPAEMQVAWLIHNETLMLSIGKPDLLEKVLAGMAKPPANPLVNEPHVKAAFALLPEGGVSSGYADAGKMIDVVLGAIKPLIAEQAEGDAAEIIENLPDQLNLPWYVVTRLYLGGESSDIRMRLSAKP